MESELRLERYYTDLGDDVLQGFDQGFRDPHKPLWLNVGYWKRARLYPQAAADLARELARFADLGRDDLVLDAGFGFGEQDLLWMKEFEPRGIIGINQTQLQVELARQKVRAAGLDDRVDLRHGTAIDCELDDATIDLVLALESAFHFDTRESFFIEAFRVLLPGGRLALADLMVRTAERNDSARTARRRQMAIPEANLDDSRQYQSKLELAGFEDVEIELISDQVFPGMSRYIEMRVAGGGIDDPVQVSQRDVEICRGRKIWEEGIGFGEYALIRATKPL